MYKNKFQINCGNEFASIKIGSYLSDYIFEDTAVICIGTDRCIVDCLGPLVGTMLKNKKIPLKIYGTLKEPVHAVNFTKRIELINKINHSNIIAVDACLSERRQPGIIEIKEGSIRPGKGIGKVLPEIGDLSIVGIVDRSGTEFQQLLQDTRLSFIFEMAEIISSGIELAFNMNNEVKLNVVDMY